MCGSWSLPEEPLLGLTLSGEAEPRVHTGCSVCAGNQMFLTAVETAVNLLLFPLVNKCIVLEGMSSKDVF